MKNKYEIRGDVTAIFVTYKGIVHECLIDTEDLPNVIELNRSWNLHGLMYVKCRYNTKPLYIHRFIMKPTGILCVDHINHNPLDNRKENLRVTDNKTNMQNRSGPQSNSTSGVRGVSWDNKVGAWLAYVVVDGKHIHIGYFDNIEEAEKEARKGRKYYHEGNTDDIVVESDWKPGSKRDKPKIDSKSGHRNISWYPRYGQWVVLVQKNKQKTHLGYHDDINDAIKARDEFNRSRQ